jgi:hypothetical protein
MTVANACFTIHVVICVVVYESKQHSVDLLVLDRTFSSLSAAAQRLIGGWTKVSPTVTQRLLFLRMFDVAIIM